MPLRHTSTPCLKCKKDIKIAKDIKPFAQINCPRCHFSISYREMQMRTKATAKKFADEFMSKLYTSETGSER